MNPEIKIRFHISNRQNFLQVLSLFLLLFGLFFPTKNIELYLIGCTFIAALLYCFNGFIGYPSFSLNVLLVIVFFIFSSATSGILFYGSSAFRNYSELLRLMPVLLIIFIYKDIYIDYKAFYAICFVYMFIDFFVSVLYFMDLPLVDDIVELYASEHHYSKVRMTGLSSGPGQHGAILVMLLAVFLCKFYGEKKHRILYYLPVVCCFISILLSQSQTSFIAASFLIFFSILSMVIKSKYKLAAFKFIIFIGLGGLFSLLRYIKNLRYLYTLFTHGLSRHSFVARLSKTDRIIESIQDNLFFFIMGHGKDFFGTVSTAMDNEYLFLFSVYGLIPALLLILFYLRTGFSICIRKVYTKYSVLLLYMIVTGLILSYPSSFLLDIRIMVIFVLVFIQHKNNQVGYNENIIYCS